MNMKQPKLAYCDYIAHIIRENIMSLDDRKLLDAVSRVQFDFGTGDKFTTTKSIDVLDMQGKQYRITVQEL